MTLAMLCTMLVLFNSGQVVEWSYCRRLLLEGITLHKAHTPDRANAANGSLRTHCRVD